MLGIARGGVIVAAAVASALRAPLDVVVIRKVGHPLQPELALGAVSASGETVLTPYADAIAKTILHQLVQDQVARAKRLEESLRSGCATIALDGRDVVIADDGIATSATMECAIAHARRAHAARIVCAAPVAPVDSIERLRRLCDGVVVLEAARERDFAVGRYYLDFSEVDDARVRGALERAREL